MNYINGMGTVGYGFGPLLIIVLLWSLFWKGLALWQSAKHNHGWWFLVILLVNTVGILEIIYLFAILKLKSNQLFPDKNAFPTKMSSSHQNKNGGFGILAIIITLAIVAIVGGGTVYAVKKSHQNKQSTVESEVQTDTHVQTSSNGTLKDLLAIGKNVTCEISNTTGSSTSSGTVYIAGTSMRGDFVMNQNGKTPVETHMIRTGNDMYAWSGAQGVKMDMTMAENTSTTSGNVTTKTTTSVGLDQKVNYHCSDWTQDDVKFSLPSDVKFMDMTSMMNTQAQIKAGVKIPNVTIPRY